MVFKKYASLDEVSGYALELAYLPTLVKLYNRMDKFCFCKVSVESEEAPTGDGLYFSFVFDSSSVDVEKIHNLGGLDRLIQVINNEFSINETRETVGDCVVEHLTGYGFVDDVFNAYISAGDVFLVFADLATHESIELSVEQVRQKITQIINESIPSLHSALSEVIT